MSRRGLQAVVRIAERMNPPILGRLRRERPYRLPAGYIGWETLSAIVALNTLPSPSTDEAARFTAHRTSLWLVQDAPIYAVSADLLASLLRTDLEVSSGLLRDLDAALPTFMLIFPAGKIRDSIGDALDFIVVHWSDLAYPERSCGQALGIEVKYIPHEFERNLHWCGVSERQTVWFSGRGVGRDGSLQNSSRDLGRGKLDEADVAFTERITSLVLQICLILQYEPDLLGEGSSKDLPQPKGFAPRGRGKEPEARYPRWLRQQQAERPSAQSAGLDQSGAERASPRTHWRRGHWRRVACGEGRAERRWHRFPPTIVKPEGDS